MAIGGRPILLGTGPLTWPTAVQYAKAGAKPPLVLNTHAALTKLRAALGLLGNLRTTLRGIGINLGLSLRGVRMAEDATWREHVTPCDALGMGRCPGRLCGPPAAEVLAAAPGVSVTQVGRLRGQPPVKPIPLRQAPP